MYIIIFLGMHLELAVFANSCATENEYKIAYAHACAGSASGLLPDVHVMHLLRILDNMNSKQPSS